MRIPKLDNVSLELTNFCNLSCWMCPHNIMKRDVGYIDYNLVEKIAKELGELEIGTLQLHGIGESLVHPGMKEIAQVLRRYNPKTNFRLSTNGSFLSIKRFKNIVNIVDNLVISIDGATKESYDKNRIGGDYEKVVNNVNLLLEERKEQNWKRPRLEIRMINLDFSQQEINQFTGYWTKKLFSHDRVYVTPVVSFGGQVDAGKRIKNCSALYRHLFILWNGDLTTCCWDSDGKNVVGNLNNETIKELFFSKSYHKLRDLHERKLLQREKDLLCHTCLEI